MLRKVFSLNILNCEVVRGNRVIGIMFLLIKELKCFYFYF